MTHDRNPNYELMSPEPTKRMLRGKLLGDLIGIQVPDMPRFRDAWVEAEPVTGKADSVRHIVIAIYTQSRGQYFMGQLEKIFTMRSNPYYRAEVEDRITDTYTTFYFDVPRETSEDDFAALVRSALEPVDMNSRWATVLGITEEAGENR